jgi:glycosyltransferase involved in cell wall biosynthesis
VIRYVTEADVTGGAEGYLARCAKHFGGDVVSSGPLPDGTRALLAGIEVREVARPRGKTDVGRLLRLTRALRGADLVHVIANEPANNRHAMAAALLARVPYVVTVQAPGPAHRTLAPLYRRAAVVVGVSRETEGIARDLGARDVRLVANGVDLPPLARRTDHTPLRVGVLGRLAPEKGLDVLLAATRDVEGIEVHVGGDGPLRAELERAGGATFHGQVEGAAFLAGLDVFCLPSRSEGLPFALLEAMAHGLPCVATAVGDVPEALSGAGLVVPPGDVRALARALHELAGNPLRRKALGQAARQRVEERYTADVMLSATADAYDAARARHRRRGPVRPPAR